MFAKPSSDLIIVNPQGKVVFSVGESGITENQEIAGTLTRVLFLFSKKVIKEQLHFIRFENHRMIFIGIPDCPGFFAVKLVTKNLLAREFVPPMKILLNSFFEVKKTDLYDDSRRTQLQVLYTILSDPKKSLFTTLKTISGFKSLIILLSGLTFDIGISLNDLIKHVRFVEEGQEIQIGEEEAENIFNISVPLKIISQLGLPLCSIDVPSENCLLANIDGETNARTIARGFGKDSNAMKMYQILQPLDKIDEVVQALLLFPPEEESLLHQALYDVVESSGKNAINAISSNLLRRLRELEAQQQHISARVLVAESTPAPALTSTPSPSSTQAETPLEVSATEDSLFASAMEEVTSDTEATSTEQSVVVPSVPVIEDEESLDILKAVEELKPKVPEPIVKETVSVPATEVVSPVSGVTERPIIPKAVYEFKTLPLVVNTTSYMTGNSDIYPVPSEGKIFLEVLSKAVDGSLVFLLNAGTGRRTNFIQVIQDNADKVNAEIEEQGEDTIIFRIEEKFFYTAYRGLIWACIVEFLDQVRSEVIKLTEHFTFPNEGSVMLIPPNRDYIRAKLPSQIVDIIEEDKLISEVETEQVHTVPKAIDTLLQRLVKPLKAGHGVAIIPRSHSQEVPEVTLLLLLISEISGIGFSRW